MATIELIPINGQEACGFPIFSSESLADLQEELLDLLAEQAGGGVLTLNFIWSLPGRPPFTIPEAFQLMVEIMAKGLPNHTIRCELASAKHIRYLTPFLPGEQQSPREIRIGILTIRLIQGDITRIRVDAIVNASNSQLHLGAGVSGAISRASNNHTGLQAAMSARAPISSGAVISTGPFGLPVKVILHAATVSGRKEIIEQAAKNILGACMDRELGSVAIPAIGAGTGGLTPATCALILRRAIEAHALRGAAYPDIIVLVLHDRETFLTFAEVFGACTEDALDP